MTWGERAAGGSDVNRCRQPRCAPAPIQSASADDQVDLVHVRHSDKYAVRSVTDLPSVGTFQQSAGRGGTATGWRFAPDIDWMRDAACVGCDPERFFGPGGRESDAGRGLPCPDCPVATACEVYAVREGLVGVWGGRYFAP